jgi:hypothetical protein
MADVSSSGNGWNLANWITAIATTATAVFAWLTYRFAVRSYDPIVESDEPQWVSNHRIAIRIVLRNRSETAHRLDRVKLLRPKGGTVMLADQKEPASDTIDMSWRDIPPVGSFSRIPYEHRSDEAYLTFVVNPPASFVSGKLCIRAIVADKSFKPRHRRFAVSKFIQAEKATNTAASINKTD